MGEVEQMLDGRRVLLRWRIEEFLDCFAVHKVPSDEVGEPVQAGVGRARGLLSDSDQEESDQSSDDLELDGIFRGSQELLDPEVLLDPLEEQFDLPPGLVEIGDFDGGCGEIIGEDAYAGAVIKGDGDLAQGLILK